MIATKLQLRNHKRTKQIDTTKALPEPTLLV